MGALPPWLPEAGDAPLKPEKDEDGAEEDGSAAWLAAFFFFRASADCVGGRVRCTRTTGGSGEHSFPSKTGGGPVRLLKATELSLEALKLLFTAHFGARLELLLLMR